MLNNLFLYIALGILTFSIGYLIKVNQDLYAQIQSNQHNLDTFYQYQSKDKELNQSINDLKRMLDKDKGNGNEIEVFDNLVSKLFD